MSAFFVLVFGAIVVPQQCLASSSKSERVEVERIIGEIDKFLAPYKQNSAADGHERRIFPLDLPEEPADWKLRAKSPPQSLPGKIRFLLRAGICYQDTMALKKVFDLEWLLYGLNFTETETLVLQRISKPTGLNLSFHSRYRQTKNYAQDVAESPQQLMQINAAFDRGDAGRAIQLVPQFKELCH